MFNYEKKMIQEGYVLPKRLSEITQEQVEHILDWCLQNEEQEIFALYNKDGEIVFLVSRFTKNNWETGGICHEYYEVTVDTDRKSLYSLDSNCRKPIETGSIESIKEWINTHGSMEVYQIGAREYQFLKRTEPEFFK